MATDKLIIVESPTKAKTIKKFLPDYKIIASMGHIRDLPSSASEIPAKFKKLPWASLGVDVDNDFKALYVINKRKLDTLKLLKKSALEAKEIYLATDEDREGESISWHIANVIKVKKTPKRMVFHEITKSAIIDSLSNLRELDMNLVNAQETRRILDRLVGYSVSPLLWKKVAPSLSAGRVQSLLVCLLVNREKERMGFTALQYWDLTALFNKGDTKFLARLHKVDNKSIAQSKDFDSISGKLTKNSAALILSKSECEKLNKSLQGNNFVVAKLDSRTINNNPPLPFITSSLQQEAIRKLKLSSKNTMRIAQSLYEKGFITYMRTDSTTISTSAIASIKKFIVAEFGEKFVTNKAKAAPKKAKNIQEAHEAIRPTSENISTFSPAKLSDLELSLYQMIWRRSMASQMAPAKMKQVSAELTVKNCLFKANGQTTIFKGYLQAYQYRAKITKDVSLGILPDLELKEELSAIEVNSHEHSTKPKGRYNEASLIKLMEKEGIGRPSTYAVMIDTLLARDYAKKDKDSLFPTMTAFAVAKLLEKKLPDLVDINFTAKMEKELDDIASGKANKTSYLEKFYNGANGLKEVIKNISKEITPQEFREVHLDGIKTPIKIGKYGAFTQFESQDKQVTIKIEDHIPPADLSNDYLVKQAAIQSKNKITDKVGVDPETNLPIYYMLGIYGPYLQVGDAPKDKIKPKRVSLPKDIDPESITPELAVDLLRLPINLGEDPEKGGSIQCNIGKFGPYIMHVRGSKKDFRSIKDINELLNISLTTAIELFNQPKGVYKKKPLKVLGKHPDDQLPIELFKGPYGVYIKWDKMNVRIPKNITTDELTLSIALDAIKERQANPPKRRGKKSKFSN
ncbi:MAG: type I DNA topoisomerase [SAR324 cluster bacterium]|nr:type I DNA topoisomerase [SAR324 cluster bacterium]